MNEKIVAIIIWGFSSKACLITKESGLSAEITTNQKKRLSNRYGVLVDCFQNKFWVYMVYNQYIYIYVYIYMCSSDGRNMEQVAHLGVPWYHPSSGEKHMGPVFPGHHCLGNSSKLGKYLCRKFMKMVFIIKQLKLYNHYSPKPLRLIPFIPFLKQLKANYGAGFPCNTKTISFWDA